MMGTYSPETCRDW